jgi:hypothetical protein
MYDDPLPTINLSELSGARVVAIPLADGLVACNPSIAADGGSLFATVRTVNYSLSDKGELISLPGGRPMSGNWLVRFDRDLAVADAQPLDDTAFRGEDAFPGGFEDCRLFRWKGGWWFSATVLVKTDPLVARIVLGRLDGVRIADCQVMDSPRQASVEKNWMPFVVGGRLGWIYRIDPLELMWQRDGAAPTFVPVGKPGPLEGWKGSSHCVGYGRRWLCVVHCRRVRPQGHFYEHRFVELTRRFRLRRMSAPFILERPVVEFCAGMCLVGRDVYLSYGVLDRKARLMRLDLAEVERLLRDGSIPRGWAWVKQVFASP